MRFLTCLLLAASFATSLAFTAFAQDASAVRDPRLRVVNFDPDQVTPVEGFIGYQVMIEFDPQERIEDVSIGDAVAWQVTPNHAATLLFIKPTEANAATNMTVVTNRRRYAFSLHSSQPRRADDPGIVYTLHFTYPLAPPPPAAANEPPPAPSPADFNFDYAITGARSVMPARVFDDGHFTYFQMPDSADTPAIFVLTNGNHEETVNTQVRGGYLVVDQIAGTFSLRYGRNRAVVTNKRASAEGRGEGARQAP